MGFHLLAKLLQMDGLTDNGLFQLFTWLQRSLRKHEKDYEANYLSQLPSLSDGLRRLMQSKFAEIIKIILVNFTERSFKSDHTVHLVNALTWNYSADDIEWLAQENLIEKLLKGNAQVLAGWGTDNNPYLIRFKAEKSMALQSFVWQSFRYFSARVISIYLDQQKDGTSIE